MSKPGQAHTDVAEVWCEGDERGVGGLLNEIFGHVPFKSFTSSFCKLCVCECERERARDGQVCCLLSFICVLPLYSGSLTFPLLLVLLPSYLSSKLSLE